MFLLFVVGDLHFLEDLIAREATLDICLHLRRSLVLVGEVVHLHAENVVGLAR